MSFFRMLLALGVPTLCGCALTLKAPDLPPDHPARQDAEDRPITWNADPGVQGVPSTPAVPPDASSQGGHDEHKH